MLDILTYYEDLFIHLLRVGNLGSKDVNSLIKVNKRIYSLLQSKQTKVKLLQFIKNNFSKLNTVDGIVNYLIKMLEMNYHKQLIYHIDEDDLVMSYLFCKPKNLNDENNIGIIAAHASVSYFTKEKNRNFLSFMGNVQYFSPNFYARYYYNFTPIPAPPSRIRSKMYRFKPMIPRITIEESNIIHYFEKMKNKIQSMLNEGYTFGTNIIQDKPNLITVLELPYHNAFTSEEIPNIWWKVSMLNMWQITKCTSNDNINDDYIYLRTIASYKSKIKSNLFYVDVLSIPNNSIITDETYKQHPYFSDLYQTDKFEKKMQM